MKPGSEKLENLINQMKAYPKVVAIFLFGSQVKGAEKPLSDIDVAVILKEPDAEIEAEIGSMYSEELDVVLFHCLPLHIQFEVLKYGREIFCRDENFLLNIKRTVLRDYLETSWLYQRIARDVLK
ncbi:MAG: nucleotidyltransferase domain-containing protein [Candidatus Freyarchaeota archaeon]|nr:nucleotidyltransferase domain-containing protein [Candidatus Jordarchaeia archaeon]MBS7269197.1 nucleotidyltransferase domain-containing protein [Candidatus Jordarchaeia archaeon]MBS7279558.1 nucleotidyltransferase domain-containing protein [Candidatus Jordarchaeia archaeon]